MDFRLLLRSAFWCITPEALALLVNRALHPEASAPTWEASKPSTIGKGGNRVAVIPIEGVLTKDGPSWLGSNYDAIATAAEQAAADPNVKHIVLAVDSPGGEVCGLPETADVLAQVAKSKPVSAIVTGQSASAAAWLTSQARDITLTPSGTIGSVGVRVMHADISKALEDAGVKVTELYAGEYKTEWSPFSPLTDAAKEDAQTRLNSLRADFVSAVANGRGARATQEIKDAHFGEGRMFTASIALNHGLVDKVQSSRDFYRAIMPASEETPAPAYGLPRARLEIAKVK